MTSRLMRASQRGQRVAKIVWFPFCAFSIGFVGAQLLVWWFT